MLILTIIFSGLALVFLFSPPSEQLSTAKQLALSTIFGIVAICCGVTYSSNAIEDKLLEYQNKGIIDSSYNALDMWQKRELLKRLKSEELEKSIIKNKG